MRIAVTSQNFREVTGHAGRTRRFIVYDVDSSTTVREVEHLDLPKEFAMHGFDDSAAHPLDRVALLITGGAGDGFIRRMARRGIRVVTTSEQDPETAVHAYLAGCLKPPHPHAPHDHPESGDSAHGCHG